MSRLSVFNWLSKNFSNSSEVVKIRCSSTFSQSSKRARHGGRIQELRVRNVRQVESNWRLMAQVSLLQFVKPFCVTNCAREAGHGGPGDED